MEMEKEFFHPVAFPVAICHHITQVNVTHIGCIVFNDQSPHLSHFP
jgi:hypothetical protein